MEREVILSTIATGTTFASGILAYKQFFRSSREQRIEKLEAGFKNALLMLKDMRIDQKLDTETIEMYFKNSNKNLNKKIEEFRKKRRVEIKREFEGMYEAQNLLLIDNKKNLTFDFTKAVIIAVILLIAFFLSLIFFTALADIWLEYQKTK